MNTWRSMRKRFQTGALGVFLCVVLAIVFGLISSQNLTTTSLDLYLSNSKQEIEEARQLAYAGLRHYTHNFGNDEAIQRLIDTHRGDPRVIGECSFTEDLPEVLDPEVLLARPDTPHSSRQEILIRGVIVPYNCRYNISDENYRATFEIVASINCSQGEGVESGCVKRSFVFNREDSNGRPYVPRRPQPPPPSAYRPPSSNQPARENPPESKGKDEVGF